MVNDAAERTALNYASVGTVQARRYWVRIFAIWGAVISLILVTVSTLVFVLVLAEHRRGTHYLQCRRNLQAVGNALLNYANANGGQYPAELAMLVGRTYGMDSQSLICDGSKDQALSEIETSTDPSKIYLRGRPENYALGTSRPWLHISYAYAGKGLTINAPASAVLAYETLSNHGDIGINVLYADGHVDWLSKAEAIHMVNELSAGHNPPRAEKIR